MEIKNITCAFAPAAAPSRKTWGFHRKKAPKTHDEIMDQKLNQMIDDGYFDESDKETERMVKEGKGIRVEDFGKIDW